MRIQHGVYVSSRQDVGQLELTVLAASGFSRKGFRTLAGFNMAPRKGGLNMAIIRVPFRERTLT